MSDFFYDKSINIMKHNEGYKDDFGIWHNGSLVTDKTIDCDVQSITKEISFRDFGISENVKYRIFCDIVAGIDVGTIVQFMGKDYIVINLLEWDYYDFIVGDYYGN